MDPSKVKLLAMIGSGLFAISQFFLFISSFVFRIPNIITRLFAVIGAILIFLFFYTIYETDQKRNNK